MGAENDAPTYWVGAKPPYSVSYIDPAICGGGADQWFVMGTVDGDPRNPQGPVAICEYEPSAHAIAYLLNANVDEYVASPAASECPSRCGRNDPCPDPWHDRRPIPPATSDHHVCGYDMGEGDECALDAGHGGPHS